MMGQELVNLINDIRTNPSSADVLLTELERKIANLNICYYQIVARRHDRYEKKYDNDTTIAYCSTREKAEQLMKLHQQRTSDDRISHRIELIGASSAKWQIERLGVDKLADAA